MLSSLDYLETQNIRAGEYYGLILLGTVGMVLMSSAMELVMMFIALEISSIATYILAGFRRRAATSAESSLKYFLLGSFATAFFLYGVALIYGSTGTTNITAIAAAQPVRAPIECDCRLAHRPPRRADRRIVDRPDQQQRIAYSLVKLCRESITQSIRLRTCSRACSSAAMRSRAAASSMTSL